MVNARARPIYTRERTLVAVAEEAEPVYTLTETRKSLA